MELTRISGIEPSDGELGALQGLTRTCTRFKGSGKARRCVKYTRRPGVPKGAKTSGSHAYRIAGTKTIKLASGRTVTAKVRAHGRSLYVVRKGICFRVASAKGGGLKLKMSKRTHCALGVRKASSARKGASGLRRDGKGRFLKRGAGRKAPSTVRKARSASASATRKPLTKSVRGRTYGWTRKGCYSYKSGAAGKGARRELWTACTGLGRRKSARALAGFGPDVMPFDIDMALFGMSAGLGAAGEEPTGSVAVIDDGDLGRLPMRGRKVRRDAGSSRRCTSVRRARTGSCVCAKWTPGKARHGEKLTEMCAAAGLRLGIAPHLGRGRAFAGPAEGSLDGAMSAADLEFLADASPKAGRVPRSCRRFESVWDDGLGRDVRVCSEFGDVAGDAGLSGLDVGPSVADAPLAGPLAKHYGFGAVGGGVGPMVAAIGGGLAASILAKQLVGRLPEAVGKIPMVGAVLPALVAGGLAYTERFRTIGIGALAGIGLLASYELVQKWNIGGPLAGLDAITQDDMQGWAGMGAITPDEIQGLGAYDDVDVLAAYDDVDVLAGGGGSVDVLAGAFGSLPFAGAI